MRTKEEGGCKVKGTGAMRAKSTHREAEGTVQPGIRGKKGCYGRRENRRTRQKECRVIGGGSDFRAGVWSWARGPGGGEGV